MDVVETFSYPSDAPTAVEAPAPSGRVDRARSSEIPALEVGRLRPRDERPDLIALLAAREGCKGHPRYRARVWRVPVRHDGDSKIGVATRIMGCAEYWAAVFVACA